MTLAAVLALSLSTLGYELLLTRYFSLAHGDHLSFLVIGIAMLGFAAGGTFASLAGDRWVAAARRRQDLFPGLCLLCSLTTAGSFLLLKCIPLDYLRFPVDRLQPLYLLASCILLSLPFFAAGLASCTAYAMDPERSAAISCAGMLGSGAGALLPLVALPVLGEGGSIAAAAMAPLLVVLFWPAVGVRPRLAGAALAAGLAALMVVKAGAALSVEPSPYKSLPQIMAAPGSRLTSRSTGLIGRVEVVEGRSLRFAPGLSLGFTGTLPPQRAVVVDGDEQTVVYDLEGMPDSASFARSSHLFAPYVLAGEAASCLVVERGGGLALACAAASGARQTTVLVENPEVARILRESYRVPGLSVEATGSRSFLARGGGRWNVIAVESWGPSVPGMASLSVDATLTVDAIRAYWRRLGDSGVLSISRRLVLPPSDSVRIFATALEALRGEGIGDPQEHLAVIRNWDTCSILVSRLPVAGPGLARLEAFAARLGFDLDYFPGITPDKIDRFNRYGRPFFADAYRDLVGDPSFVARYPLDVAPQGDDRPFPSRFLRWSRIGDFYRITGERVYLLFLSGELIAAAALAEGAAVCLLLLLLPLAAGAKRTRDPGAARPLAVFAAIGLGFMFCEMCLIDSLALLFPGASVTLAVVLFGLLASSAAGGLLSARLSGRGLRGVLAGATLLLAALALSLPLIVHALLPLGPTLRVAGALVVTGVPGVLLGIPFPAAMRGLGGTGPRRAYAWAVNGSASVLASTGSALVAMSAGWMTLGLLAAASYAAAAILLPSARAWNREAGEL
ncbi:MAG: hypothetical protein NT005_10330 [Spirochaetes bacterium]|nr:hypothetical protein [Spirochaetota bacterium]